MVDVATRSLPYLERVPRREREAIIRAVQSGMAAITSARSLDEELRAILTACCDGLGNPYASLVLIEGQGDWLTGRFILSQGPLDLALQAMRSAPPPRGTSSRSRANLLEGNNRDGVEDVRPPDAVIRCAEANDNVLAKVFLEQKALVTKHLYDIFRPYVRPPVAANVQRLLGIRSVALAPLLDRERCLGVLVVAFDRPQPVTGLDLTILNVFASQAAVAIEDARLRQELREREEQVSFLLKATIDAQEDERERICLDLHDGVSQTLAAAFHYLQTLDSWPELPDALRTNVGKAGMLVRHAIHESREVLSSLRPAALDTLGLVATLQYELDGLQAQMGWQIDFDADQVRFPKAVETALYRIVHEALTNVTKHARATRVSVRVKQQVGHIVAEVRDDGAGFDPRSLDRQLTRNGVGLLSMRKRAELLHGSFRVVSSPCQGTLVRVEVPLPGSDIHIGLVSTMQGADQKDILMLH